MIGFRSFPASNERKDARNGQESMDVLSSGGLLRSRNDQRAPQPPFQALAIFERSIMSEAIILNLCILNAEQLDEMLQRPFRNIRTVFNRRWPGSEAEVPSSLAGRSVVGRRLRPADLISRVMVPSVNADSWQEWLLRSTPLTLWQSGGKS